MNINTFSTRGSRLFAVCLAIALVAADEPKKAAAPPVDPAEREALEIAQALRESWPDHPEWLDMLTAILDDEPMGPEFGWFRTARSQSRFGWDAARRRYDRDGDGRISRKELSASDADFARLDRDRDGVLMPADFDFSGSALDRSPGAMMFGRLDRDGNGRVTREEIGKFFQAADSGGQGFLSLSDLQEAFTPPRRARSGSGGPSKATLVRGLFRREIGSLEPGPNLEDSAPDFALKSTDGKSEVTLSKLIGPKPVVLVFGNFTCGPFRSQAGNVEKLYRRYKDRATFVMVYVREAHPTDGWRMESNERVGVSTAQPRTYGERAEVARTCGRLLDLGFPMLVDTIDDRAGNLYSGMPGRLYLIDGAGKIAFKSGRGPYFFKPAELEQALVMLLQEHPAGGNSAASAPAPGHDQQPGSTVPSAN